MDDIKLKLNNIGRGAFVIALCPYVLAQFKRHPEQYADIWNQNWHS